MIDLLAWATAHPYLTFALLCVALFIYSKIIFPGGKS